MKNNFIIKRAGNMPKRVIISCILLMFSFSLFAAYQAPTQAVTRAIGKDGIPKPDWAINGFYPDDDYHYVVANYKMPTRQASIARAQAACTTAIALEIGVAAQVLVEDFMQVAGEGGTANYQQLDYFVQATRQKANTMVRGLVRFDTWESTDGEVYVLMGIPVENVQSAVEGILDDVIKEQDFKKNKAAGEAMNQFKDFMSTDFANAFSSVSSYSAAQ